MFILCFILCLFYKIMYPFKKKRVEKYKKGNKNHQKSYLVVITYYNKNIPSDFLYVCEYNCM